MKYDPGISLWIRDPWIRRLLILRKTAEWFIREYHDTGFYNSGKLAWRQIFLSFLMMIANNNTAFTLWSSTPIMCSCDWPTQRLTGWLWVVSTISGSPISLKWNNFMKFGWISWKFQPSHICHSFNQFIDYNQYLFIFSKWLKMSASKSTCRIWKTIKTFFIYNVYSKAESKNELIAYKYFEIMVDMIWPLA